MPLPVPELPTRTWDELVEEARALIVRAAPSWTDYNAHDPGITVLELLAFYTEALLYRADRVTPELRRAFLRLMGIEPHAPGVASTVVAVRAPAGVRPAGTIVASAAGDVRFASAEDLWVSPAWLGSGEGALASETSGEVGPLDPARPFLPFGPAPAPGDAFRIGFERAPFELGRVLSLHFWTDRWELEDEAPRHPERCDPRVMWEYWAGAWRELADVTDTTVALGRSGRVGLRGPAGHAPSPDGRWWIRARLIAGGHDRAPILTRCAVNAVDVRHAVAVGAEPVGVSLGHAHQRYALRSTPVVPGSTRLPGWTEVAEWDRSGPADRHYRLDPVAGTIEFGDGRRGKVPRDGLEVVLDGYATGGGAAGNVPPGTLATVPGGMVLQPAPARGGNDAEPLDRAHGRALDRLVAATRAVTVEDCERLARSTPDARVARARALPGHHRSLAGVEARGVVTLVVIPPDGDPPVPAPALLAAVERHVRCRRPLGTELHVVGPVYREVTVSATLHARRGAASGLAERAVAALRSYLDPLRGGPDGTGWPFGRDLLTAELLALLGAMDDVTYVEGLGLADAGDTAPRCGNLPLCGTELVSLKPPRITVIEEEA